MVLVKRNPVATNVIIPKIQVTRRQKVPPLAEQYQARIKDQPDHLLAQCAIARWCVEKCLMNEALVHTKKAEVEDTDNPIVARLYTDLGYVKDDTGAWVKEDEYLAKTGKVNFAGKIMTPEQAEKAKAIAKLTAERDVLQQQIRDADWSTGSGEDKVKDLTEKLGKAKENQARNKADSAGAKARMEQLNKRIADRTARQQNGNNNGARNQTNPENDRKELQEATATASKSTQDQAAADRAVADAEKRLTEVKTRMEKAKTELPTWKKRLEEVQIELAKLTGKPVPGAEKAGAEKTGEAAAKTEKAGDKPSEEAAKPKSRFGN